MTASAAVTWAIVVPDESPDDAALPDRAGRPGSGPGNPLDL